MVVVAPAEIFLGVAVEVAEVVLVLERPLGDLGAGGLLSHEGEVLFAYRGVNRAEDDVLVFTHGLPKVDAGVAVPLLIPLFRGMSARCGKQPRIDCETAKRRVGP